MVPRRFIHPLRDVGAHLRWAVVAKVVAMHQAHCWWELEQPRFWTYFHYRPQTSDFSIVYNLSLPAMWSGYVIVFRGCFRNRGCFRIAAVPMMASARQNHLSDQGIPCRHGTERHNPHCEFVILSINIDTCLLNSKILAGLNLDVLEYFRNLVPYVCVCTAVIVINLVFEY